MLHNACLYFPRQYSTLKNGNTKLRGSKYYKWFDTPHRLIYSYTVGEYQKIKLTQFDPGSRHKIRHWLKADTGFTFSTFTEKGTPKVDGDELEALGEYGADLRRYLKIVKDHSQLRGLLEAVREDSTITSRVDTNGTVTGRFTSSSVNLNQIPAQKEFRSLFAVPEGWTFIGTDFDGQENVNLAEALYQFDNGRLDKIISSGEKDEGTDLHSLNAKATGLSRSDSKPLWFGFLYGSSSTLTGYTLLGKNPYDDYTPEEYRAADRKIQKRLTPPDEFGNQYYPVKSGQSAVYVLYEEQLVKQAIYGKHMQERLIKSTDGLAELIKHLEEIVQRDGGITTLGGRFVPVDSPHKCLNYFCQGQGAEAMKMYLRYIHRELASRGLIHGRDYIQQACIYDEVDMIARDEYVDIVSTVLKDGYAIVSSQLGMKCTYTGEVMTSKESWYSCH